MKLEHVAAILLILFVAKEGDLCKWIWLSDGSRGSHPNSTVPAGGLWRYPQLHTREFDGQRAPFFLHLQSSTVQSNVTALVSALQTKLLGILHGMNLSSLWIRWPSQFVDVQLARTLAVSKIMEVGYACCWSGDRCPASSTWLRNGATLADVPPAAWRALSNVFLYTRATLSVRDPLEAMGMSALPWWFAWWTVPEIAVEKGSRIAC